MCGGGASCQLWVSRVSSRCFWWDGHVHGVTRGVTRERVSECGGAMERAFVCTLVGCRRETGVKMNYARTLLVRGTSQCVDRRYGARLGVL